MFERLKRWLSPRSSNNETRGPASVRTSVPDNWTQFEQQPLSVDAQLAIANGRMTEEVIRENIRRKVQRFRESVQDDPASLGALSIVDPFTWAMDTPDFYPGAGLGMGGWGVPWFLNNQGRGDVLPVYINEYGLKLIRDWSRRICQYNEFCLNAIENRISYITGKGFQYTVVPKKRRAPQQALGDEAAPSDGLASAAQAVLDEFISRTRWSEREQECVRRCDRDGEAFLRFFHVGGGRATVRFVEPEYVTDQQGSIHRQYGVVTTPGDVEDVQAYSVVEYPATGWTAADVAADEILHVKLNTDFDSKRGLPTFFPVRKNLERADKLLRNMSTLAQVQATFAVIRKHEQFAPSSVSAYQQGQADASVSLPASGRSLGVRQLMPGSIIDTSAKTEYEFPSAGVDAGQLVAVLQAELRAICARLVMPEWMLTIDASNGNFAGQLVSGAPSVEMFKRTQSVFARRFGDGNYGPHAGAMWRVLRIAVEGGLLPPAVLEDCEIQAEGPSITVVNKAEETRRAESLFNAGLLSPETWAKWEGLDYQQEKALGAKPQPEATTPGLGGVGGLPASAPPGSAKGDKPDASSGLGKSAVQEDVKMVFGRCVDTDTHHVVPCPAKGDHGAPGKRDLVSPESHQAAIDLAMKKFETNPAPTKEELKQNQEGMAPPPRPYRPHRAATTEER